MTISFRLLRGACALLLFLVPHVTDAQARGASPARAAAPGEIRGRLVAAGSAQPIGGGSVTIRRASDNGFAGGALPAADGSFHVDGLAAGRYTVRVRALGYAPAVRSDVAITADHPVVDLGTLTLSPVAAQIAGQTVTAERDEVVLAPDRNVYSTKNMTTASGGTAIDVLRNVPSVEVDASNQVSLRGNQNVVVQINGRSSPLKGEQLGNFLAQLPASTIRNVEVSTNPSAKNDPEGTAGIINIVLNQDADIGVSGGVTAAAGTTGQANFSGNVGRQSGPLTLFVSYGLYHNHQQMDGHSEQVNLAIPTPAYVDSRIDGSGQPLWQNGSFRSEYRFTPHDALSADAMISGGRFSRNNASFFTDLDTSRAVIGLYDQFSDQSSRNVMQDYNVAFRRTGDARARTFSTELRLTQMHGRSASELYGILHQGDASTGAMAIPREHDVTTNGYPSWDLQTDFTQPFGAHTKLESGLKEILRHTTSDFAAAYLDSASGTYVPAPSRTTDFDYREQIGAVYAVLSQQVAKVQAQAGLRLEEAATQLGLPTAPVDSQHFDNRYASAFPSGIVSYNFTPTRQVKLSYSRRVTRPNPFQLSPVEFRQDARTLFHGNPSLRAEYTDAIELGLQDSHSWGTVQLNPYVRHTAHAVRFIQTIDSTGVSVGTFDNVASTLEAGTDLNVTYRGGPLMLFAGGSAYRYRSDAANLAGNLSTRALVWSTRANATWKLSPVLDAQLFANYRSGFATEGGRQNAFVFMNFALRRKLWHDKGSLTLRVADPFDLMNFGSVTSNPRVIQSTVRSFGMRGIYIAFSRNFGQELKLRPRQQDTDQPQVTPQPGVP